MRFLKKLIKFLVNIMTIYDLLKKYNKYQLVFFESNKTFIFQKKVPTKEFARFKRELKANCIKYDNIRVLGRW